MLDKINLNEFEKKLGYTFKNKESLKIALTHKSYAYENGTLEKGLYNERIEYLGDAILEHIISDFLYHYTPTLNEGNMTKKRAEIVCEKSLSEAFSKIDGDKYIYVGKCDMGSSKKKQDAIVADAFESVLGAVYLDSDYNTARDLALRLLKNQINDSLSGKTLIVDYKTMFQELAQKDARILDLEKKVILYEKKLVEIEDIVKTLVAEGNELESIIKELGE